MISKEKRTETMLAIFLVVACFFPLFMHLTTPAIRLFDESRLALSAIEMSKSGNFLVVNYLGAPDLWSTKPPLMIFLQTICLKLFGINEFSIRIPAALSALFICAIIFLLFARYLKNSAAAIGAVLILITCSGFVREHIFRTGDYDALLTLLSLIFLLAFFIFIEHGEVNANKKYLLYFFLALTLSVLCKGIQGLLFLPTVIIYAAFRKKIHFILKQKYFYIGLAFFFVFGIGYYILREFILPGYITAVWNNELGGRFNVPLENHEGAFSYYFLHLINEDFKEWYLFVPCGILVGIFHTNSKIRNLSIFVSIAVIQYLLIISFAQTKLWWYEAPLLPLLTILAGIFISWILEIIRKSPIFQMNNSVPVTAIIFLFLLFINPYANAIKKVFLNEEDSWAAPFYEIPNYLRHAADKKINLNGNKIIYADWPSSILFYQKLLEEKNQKVTVSGISEITIGDTIIVQNRENYFAIDSIYNIKYLDGYKNVIHMEIVSEKKY